MPEQCSHFNWLERTSDDCALRNHPKEVERLIERMKSLHDGEPAVVALIDLGHAAVPALREVLYKRDPSGIFEIRCRAVKALAAIGAREVLLEFVDVPTDVGDPVARLGEEAVINAAARALRGWHTSGCYDKLLRIAKRRLLPGVIESLADFKSIETIPIMIAALAEDFSRIAAEEGLREIGVPARKWLIEAITSKRPSCEWESPTSVRRRRSAFQLLLEIGIEEADWAGLKQVIDDHDPALALLACKLCLCNPERAETTAAIHRLLSLAESADWFLAGEIENCLVEHFAAACRFVDRALRKAGDPSQQGANSRLIRTLSRVKERGETAA